MKIQNTSEPPPIDDDEHDTLMFHGIYWLVGWLVGWLVFKVSTAVTYVWYGVKVEELRLDLT